MKDGKLVEYGSADQVLAHPQHSYTQASLRSVPRLARRALGRSCQWAQASPACR